MKRALPLLGVAALAGCGGSGPQTPTIGPAKVYRLTGLQPLKAQAGKPSTVAFTVEQPSGAPLTKYRTGAGPHTGVHLIVVKNDLSLLIHRHPPVSARGRVDQPLTFPSAGRYRVVADIYPRTGPRNFQLSYDVRVAGRSRTKPLPPFEPEVTVDGYRVVVHGRPKLRAIRPTFLRVTVTDPDGRPAVFKPYFGALAHAIFFSEGDLAYFHTHVCGPDTPGCTSTLGGARVTGRSEKPGQLRVGVLLPAAGVWRMFLQFEANGKVVTAPFTLRVT